MLLPDVMRSASPVHGGFATSVLRIQVGRRTFAFRVFGEHGHAARDREVSVHRASRGNGLPVPAVRAIGEHAGRPALLLDWCAGRTVLEVLRERPLRIALLACEFGRVQAAIHRVSAPTGLRSGWMDWPTPAADSLRSRLARAGLRSDRLLHLDYHPLNVVARGGRVTGVLDWTNSHAGDPRADFARTLSILRCLPLGQPRGAAGLLFEAGWRLGYGWAGTDLAPFYAWAGGAMLADLAQRYTYEELASVRRWTECWLARSR